jgi:Transposase IS116/IS110/IS902 family
LRERIERLEQAMRDSVPEWSLAPIVEALQALRGIDLISAVVFMSEIGDLSRFESPRQLMATVRHSNFSLEANRVDLNASRINPCFCMTSRAAVRAGPRQGSSRGFYVADH